jgi:hypothetical protein
MHARQVRCTTRLRGGAASCFRSQVERPCRSRRAELRRLTSRELAAIRGRQASDALRSGFWLSRAA